MATTGVVVRHVTAASSIGFFRGIQEKRDGTLALEEGTARLDRSHRLIERPS